MKRYTFQVPAGQSLARWSTFAAASSAAVDDIDLYVYRETATGLVPVGISATGASDETVNVNAPPAGGYRAYVHNWDSDAPTNDITLFSWLLDGAAKGNANVTAPGSVSLGQSVPVSLSWSGLAAGQRYLGRVVYADGTQDRAATVVSVTVP